MVTLKVKKINQDAILPNYAHQGDAGMDIYSCEDVIIEPKQRKLVSTGITTEFPEGYVALVWDKSGLAAKSGIKTMAGVIDCHYRGEWKIVLLNTTDEPYNIKKGDKIAQALIQPIIRATITEFQELSETARGAGGFGSTGINNNGIKIS